MGVLIPQRWNGHSDHSNSINGYIGKGKTKRAAELNLPVVSLDQILMRLQHSGKGREEAESRREGEWQEVSSGCYGVGEGHGNGGDESQIKKKLITRFFFSS